VAGVARKRQATSEFQALYRPLAAVERKILMNHGLRRARYLDLNDRA